MTLKGSTMHSNAMQRQGAIRMEFMVTVLQGGDLSLWTSGIIIIVTASLQLMAFIEAQTVYGSVAGLTKRETTTFSGLLMRKEG